MITDLTAHHDPRGAFTEVFRAEWPTGVAPVQWNLVRSEARVLRGVHVHHRHDDYLLVVNGTAIVGLTDLRRGSATENMSTMVTLDADHPRAITIPHGVAHGFYFPHAATHLYSVSDYWDHDDELGCHYADPDLGLCWPDSDPVLSPRDATAGSLAAMRAALERAGQRV